MSKFKRIRRLAAAFTVAALATTAIAFAADSLLADGDQLAAFSESDMAFGNVQCNQGSEQNARLALRHNGGGNTFASGSTVTVSVVSTSGPISASMQSSTITLPSNWDTNANNGNLSAEVISKVTVTPTTSGAGSGSVSFKATGVQTTSSGTAALERTETLPVSWTAGSCDTTAPTSTATAKNADDSAYAFGTWTNQNVTVTLSGQDNTGGSGLKEIRYTTNGTDPTASTGTVYSTPFTISSEGTTTVKWIAIDNTGNVESPVNSSAVKIDKTAPTITDEGPTAGPNGDNNWYTSDVTNKFKAVDGGSGLSATCDAAFDDPPGDIRNVTTTGEGSAVKASSGPCSDVAGNNNTGILSAAFKVDKTLPTSSGTAKNADDSAYTFGGWTNQNVTVTLSGNDAAGGSGLREVRYTTDGSTPTASSGTVYTAPFTISSEATTTIKWRAIDEAGNLEAVHSETVMIDKAAPTITDEGATTGPDGENGWYKSNVTNQFKAVDAVSGLSTTCAAAFNQPGSIKHVVISTEGSAVTGASGACSDAAGNTNSGINSAAFMIDKTAPSVSVTGVTDGASYTVGSVPTAGCSTSDGTSGVQTNATLSSTGGPVGSITATCSGGKDNAGNTAAASATYSVLFAFNGFYQPIDNGGVFNKAKAGSAIPVKFSLDGAPRPGTNTPGDGGATSVFASGSPSVAVVACPTSTALFDSIEELATDSTSGLKYDPVADQWVYVWKTTTSLANSCRQLKVTLADGTVRTANFNFTK
jgi:hypothetical protein